jgi:hypothetical protein
MQIQHNLNGGRTTMSQSNGKRIATNGKNSGYVQSQKPYATGKNGQAYYSRTSYNNGQASTGTYVGFNFGGQQYFGYQPQSYYSPAFYGWASDPWQGQIAFGIDAWGWNGAPWLGYYGFAPYSYYAGPAYWLTDYVLAAELQAAYGEAAVEVAPVAAVSPAIPVNAAPALDGHRHGGGARPDVYNLRQRRYQLQPPISVVAEWCGLRRQQRLGGSAVPVHFHARQDHRVWRTVLYWQPDDHHRAVYRRAFPWCK